MRAEKSGENRELMTKLSPPQRLLPLAKEEGIADCWKEIADCWKEIADWGKKLLIVGKKLLVVGKKLPR